MSGPSPPANLLPALLASIVAAEAVPTNAAHIQSASLVRLPDDSKAAEFLKGTHAHLFEAQRLVRSSQAAGLSRSLASITAIGARRARQRQIAAVRDCCRDSQKRLSDVLADYGRQAQALDQAFPHRLVEPADPLALPDLSKRLTALGAKVADLKMVGILDETNAPSFDVGCLETLDDTRTKVLSLYVEQTEAKLEALNSFAGRLNLFLDNVNEKYLHKRARLDRTDGLLVENDGGERMALETLSPGEQHEFVLQYDLLFRVEPNTLVLIDEPEVSLHVTWQKQFLPDLIDIVKLVGIDVIVATHSPYIAGYRDDLMVRLGDPL